MPVRGIDCDHVYLCRDERRNSFHCVRRRADRRADEQSAVFIARGIGVLDGFFNVFYGNKPF